MAGTRTSSLDNSLNNSLSSMDWLPRLNVAGAVATAQGHPPAKPKPVDYRKGGKPPYSYATIITFAISSSPRKKMTLSEIYTWICSNFAFYRIASNTGWKNSIRHNLSLNKLFIKLPRCKDSSGKGHYWALESNPPDDLEDHMTPEVIAHHERKLRNAEGRYRTYTRNSNAAQRFPETHAAIASITGTAPDSTVGVVTDHPYGTQPEGPNVIVQSMPDVGGPLGIHTGYTGGATPTPSPSNMIRGINNNPFHHHHHHQGLGYSPQPPHSTEVTDSLVDSFGSDSAMPTLATLNRSAAADSSTLLAGSRGATSSFSANHLYDELNASFNSLYRAVTDRKYKPNSGRRSHHGDQPASTAQLSVGEVTSSTQFSLPSAADLNDLLHNLDSLKESVRLAGEAGDLQRIDMNQFHDLLDNVKHAEANNWSVDTNHITDLALSLSQFLANNGVLPSSTTTNSGQDIKRESDVHELDDEIIDDFDWNSIM